MAIRFYEDQLKPELTFLKSTFLINFSESCTKLSQNKIQKTHICSITVTQNTQHVLKVPYKHINQMWHQLFLQFGEHRLEGRHFSSSVASNALLPQLILTLYLQKVQNKSLYSTDHIVIFCNAIMHSGKSTSTWQLSFDQQVKYYSRVSE